MLFSSAFKFAHEAYVLTPEQVSIDKDVFGPNIFESLSDASNLYLFIFITLAAPVLLGLVFFLRSTSFFQRLGRWLDKSTYFVPDIIRVAFGASLILSAANNAVFGPELPLSDFPAPGLLELTMYIAGISLLFGAFIRFFGWLMIIFWCVIFTAEGWYVLTYINYLGEAIAVVLLSNQVFSVDRLRTKWQNKKPLRSLYEQYSMPMSRILFGASLLYAAVSVKFLNPAVSLDVVYRYNLTDYFPLDPMFIVLGAALTELGLAVLFMFGFLRRFISVIFLTFLSLSVAYFGEDIWPHLLLIAFGVGIFLHKPDIWSLDSRLDFKKLTEKLSSSK